MIADKDKLEEEFNEIEKIRKDLDDFRSRPEKARGTGEGRTGILRLFLMD